MFRDGFYFYFPQIKLLFIYIYIVWPQICIDDGKEMRSR